MNMLLSFSSFMSYLGYIVLAIVVLLFMVLIHELGHYTAGKMLKFKINEFSVGFGPKLLQKKRKNGELISLRAFPLGGYCAFEGENEDNKNPAAFNNQKPWKRLIVLFFGAFFNFLSGIIFSFILLVSCGYDLIEVKTIEQTSINYNILQTGDVLLGVDGEYVDFVYDVTFDVLITNKVKDNPEYRLDLDREYETFKIKDKDYTMQLHPINFNIKRNGKKQEITAQINIVYNDANNQYGWTVNSTYNDETSNEFVVGVHRYTFTEALTQAVPFAFKWAWKIIIIFGKLITGKLGITSLGGPVTTVKMMATNTRANILNMVVLMPVIAINLAVFNLLPIPALDGCQMVFVIIEMIRRKPINPKVTNAINNIGLIVLLGFVLIVDLLQFI